MYRRQFFVAAASATSLSLGGCTSPGTDGVDGPLDGEWVLRARISNEDEQVREWTVECRAQDRNSLAAGSGQLPAGEVTELELSGLLYEEKREIYVQSDGGALSQPWRPTECNRLSAEIRITAGMPDMSTECRTAQATSRSGVDSGLDQ